MPIQNIQEFNATGIDGLFQYAAQVEPTFTPLLLFTIFMISMLGTYFSNRRMTGKSDFAASFAVGGWFTLIIAFVLNLMDGVINVFTMGICIAVAIIGLAFLIFSRD